MSTTTINKMEKHRIMFIKYELRNIVTSKILTQKFNIVGNALLPI